MNESVEYVIRVILRARDDLSATLAKIREEIRSLDNDADSLDLTLSKVNAQITSLNNRARSAAENLGKLKKATDDLGGSVEKFNKLEGDLAKAEDLSEKATERQRDAMGRKVVVVQGLSDSTKDLTKSDKELAIAEQLERLSTEKSTAAKKDKTAASKEAERQARKEVDKLLIQAYKDEAAANTERAESLKRLTKEAKEAKVELRELKQLQGIGPRVTSERAPKDFDPGMLEALRKAEKKADDAITAREEARREAQKASQAAIAERVRAAGGTPAAEDPRVKETEKQLGIARREERKAKRDLAEALEEAGKVDLETAKPAELTRLKQQQETLERGVRAAGTRVSNAFAASKKAEEDAQAAQRETLVQHVLAMQASSQRVEAEKKEASAIDDTTKATERKTRTVPRPAGGLTEQQVIDKRNAATEAQRALERAQAEPRFQAREFGESSRRFQVYDEQLEKVVKRLGSLARAEEEAGKANLEHQQLLAQVVEATADQEGARKRFEENERRQAEEMKRRTGGGRATVKKEIEVEPEVVVDLDKAEAAEEAVEETIKKTVGKKTKVRKEVEIELDEPEVDIDWDPDEILEEALGFEHMEEEGFDVTPHINIEREEMGHYAEQESFTGGLGIGGGSPEGDRRRAAEIKRLYTSIATSLKEAGDRYKEGNLTLREWHEALAKTERNLDLLGRKSIEVVGSQSKLTQSILSHASLISGAQERIGGELVRRREEGTPQTPRAAAATFLANAIAAVEDLRQREPAFTGGIGLGGGSQEADEGLRKLERDNEAEHKLRQKQQSLLARLNAAYEDQRAALSRLFAQYGRGLKPAREFVIWLEEAEKATRKMARQATGLGTFDPEATARLTEQANKLEELRKQVLEREERKAGKAAEEIEAEGEAIRKTTVAYEEHDGTLLEVEEHAIELHDKFRQLKIDFDEGRVSANDARDSFIQMGQELRKLARASDVQVGSLTQHGLFALAREPEAEAQAIKDRNAYVEQVGKALDARELKERDAANKRIEAEQTANEKARDNYVNVWEKGLEARDLLERDIARKREARDKRAVEAARQYDLITKGVPGDLVNLDDRDIARLNILKRELDAVARSYDTLSEEQLHFASLSRLTNQVIQEHTAALRDDRRALDQSTNAVERAAARDRLAASARARFGDATGIRAMSERRAEQITPEDRVALQDLAKDLRAVANEHERGSDAQRHYASMAVVVEDAVKRVSATLNEHERTLRSQRSQIGGLAGFFDRMSKAVNRSGDSVAALDNRLQGMVILAVMAFAQQFISVLLALAGTLGAVASSALFAAGAIGGSLVAGIAQALPMIGLLVATMSRVSAVMDIVKQADLVDQQKFQRANDSSKKLADTTDAVASAQDGLRNATDSLGDAHRRVADAQENLTRARADAARQLRDLILAEKDAELAARGAALNQEDAQQRILDAVTSGQGDLDRLGLDFEQAQLDRQRAAGALTDVRGELRTRRRGGVEGAEGVVQAKRQVEDAQRAVVEAERSVERARRGIDQARRSADAASVDAFAGAEKLQFLLQQLTPAEREFYRAALALREQYKEVFRPVTDILIRELTKGTDDLTALLKQPKIGQAARGLANSIAGQMSRVREELFDPELVDQLLRIVEQSKRNLKPVTDIIINLGHSLANIAEAAGPAFERILGWFEGLSGRIRDLTEDKAGLESFFDKAADNAIAWFDAIEAVIVLIGTIAGIGADTGLSTVEGFTQKIKEWTEWIESHRSEVDQFFRDSVEVAKQLFRIVEAVAELFVEVNDPDSVKPLVDFITGTLAPALESAIEFMGDLTEGILWFLNLPGVGKAVEVLIMIALVNKVLRTTSALLGTSMTNWRNLSRTVRGVFSVLNALTFGGLNKALGIIATSVGGLVRSFPGLKKLGDKLKEVGDRLRGRGPGGTGPIVAPGTGAPPTGPGGGPVVVGDIGPDGKPRPAPAPRGRTGILPRITGLFRGGGIARTALGFAGKAGAVGAALTLGINLIDSKGDPIRALRNTASDLTFGIIPRVGGEDGRDTNKVKIQVDVGDEGDTEKVQKKANELQSIIDQAEEDLLYTYDVKERRGLKDKIRRAGEEMGKTFATAYLDNVEESFKVLDVATLTREFSQQLSSIPREGRQAALDEMATRAREFEKQGKLPKGAAAKIVSDISKTFDILPSNMSKSAGNGTKAMARELRKRDVITAAEKLREELSNVFQGYPKLSQTTGKNAAQNFIEQLEFLRRGVRTSSGSTKKLYEEALKDMESLSGKYGRRMKTGLIDQLDDMGVKGDKKARKASRLIVAAYVDMTNGVGRSAEKASLALFDQLDNMNLNAGKILKGLGIKPPTIKLNTRAYKKSGIDEMTRVTGHAQAGKFISGQGDGDKHPVLVESGEYILNKKAVANLGRKALDYINYNLFPRFQKGGEANWGGHTPLHGAIEKAVAAVQNKFPSMAVTSTLRNTTTRSGNPSLHNVGIAADIGSTPGVMRSAAEWIKSSGMAKSLVEGIHNPNLSISDGATVSAGFWGSGTWADHIDHIHMALRSLAGFRDAGLKLLGQVLATGPDGILKKVALGYARKVRLAYNRFIRRKYDSQGGGDDQSYPVTKGALSENQVKSVIRTALSILDIKSSIGDWVRTMTRQAYNESTFNPNARNDTAAGRAAGGPKGLLQVVDGTFAAYKYPGHNNVFNALDNTLAAIRYVISRYGAGNADRAVDVLWGRGGGAYAEGGEIPGPRGMPVPILAHAREWILNPLQQSFIARIAGTTTSKLKSALGFGGSHERGFQQGGDTGDSFFKPTSATSLFTTKAEQDRIRRIRLGIFRLPAIPLDSWEDVVREANRAMRALGHVGNAWRVRIRDINRQIEDLRTNISKEDKERIAELKKGGVTDREAKKIAEIRKDVTDAEQKKIDALLKERRELRRADPNRIKDITKQIADIRDNLTKADKERIEALKKGGVTAKEAKEIAQIQGDITKEEQKKIDALKDERAELRKHPGRRGRRRTVPAAQQRLRTLDQLTREGGILDLMDEQRELEAQEAINQQLIGVPAGTIRRDRNIVKRTRAEINKITKQIAKLRKDGTTKKERAKIKALRDDLRDEQDDLKDEQAQLKADIAIQARRAFRIVRGARGRIARVVRRTPLGGRTVEQDQARFERQAAQTNVRRIEREQAVVGESLGDAEKRLRTLQRGGVSKKEAPEVAKLTQQITNLRKRGEALRQEQAEGIQSLFEAQVAQQEADINAINARAERAGGAVDRGRRIASALGKSTAAFDQAQIGIVAQQASDLEKQIARARRMGNVELAQSLEDQVAELRTSIVEMQAQMLRDAIEQVEQAGQRRLTRIDIQSRFAEVAARRGDRQGAAGTQVELQRQRTATFQDTRAQLLALQQRAAAEGNTGAVLDLQERIEDLDATIAESVQTTQDLIVATHQLSVDIIKSRTETATGLFGTARQIIEGLGGLSGITDPKKILPILQGIGTTLVEGGIALLGEIGRILADPVKALGQWADEVAPILAGAAAAFQAGPEAFANWLAANAPAIATLIEQVGGINSPIGALIMSLIGGLGDNVLQTLANTQAIKDLTKAQTQDWSSSAWQMFRQAIFTGAGELLPQYVVPSAQTGVYVRRSGLVNAHVGEVIGNPERLLAGAKNGDNNYDVCVNIETPMQVADPVDLGNRIGYRLANNPNTR